MKLQSQDILKHVLFAGPDRRAKGGIASVTSIYEEALGPITYLTTTRRGNKLLSALRFGLALLQLPYYRLRGFRIIHAHGSVRGSWRRKCLLLDWAGLLGMRTIHHLHSGDMRTYFAAAGNEKAARNLRRRDAVVALTRSWQ
ncbi:MAG: hypothetical protein K2L99_04720, partial [Muribaculaceae bacterium]|nr:hypothetical protein [Muribaculaceae bacterium]